MQRHDSLSRFLATSRAALARGPVALMFAEDTVEQDSTIRHLQARGFRAIIVFAPKRQSPPAEQGDRLHLVAYDTRAEGAVPNAVNRIIAAAPGVWIHYCFNAEYLFHPFCETRSVGEMLSFHGEERRDAMLTFVIDLYAGNLQTAPRGVALDDAHLDRTGYFALGRPGGPHGHPMERQLDFFGGIRWRFEEHIAKPARRIDRIALFRAQPGLELLPDHRFNIEEYNTYACPWHNNLTAVIASFRAAKALRTNPGSAFDIDSFTWHNSIPFQWHSGQLLELGLMEPGQWF